MKTLLDRILDRVVRCPVKGCWEWKGAASHFGHGMVTVRGMKPRVQRVHRVVYGLLCGPIAPGLFVCHKCDNPSCCNPAHLFIGTAADNNRDSKSKGRNARGETCGPSRLSADEVRRIRSEWAGRPKSGARSKPGHGSLAMSERFGVSKPTILRVVRGETWKDST